jgi:hypothetical protein
MYRHHPMARMTQYQVLPAIKARSPASCRRIEVCLTKSDSFTPPGLPVIILILVLQVASTGVVFKPAQDDSSKAVPKLNDNIRPKRVNLQIR